MRYHKTGKINSNKISFDLTVQVQSIDVSDRKLIVQNSFTMLFLV